MFIYPLLFIPISCGIIEEKSILSEPVFSNEIAPITSAAMFNFLVCNNCYDFQFELHFNKQDKFH